MSDMLGDEFQKLRHELDRIKKYRNKIIHGQPTGLKIQSRWLEKDIDLLKKWILAVANGYGSECGYDGLHRGSFRKADSSLAGKLLVTFNTIDELTAYIDKTLKRMKHPTSTSSVL
jgi:hypothetical protein